MGTLDRLLPKFKTAGKVLGVFGIFIVVRFGLWPYFSTRRLKHHGGEAEKLIALRRKRLEEEGQPTSYQPPNN